MSGARVRLLRNNWLSLGQQLAGRSTLERKIRFCACERRIQRDCATVRFFRFVHAAEITENESGEIVCVGIRRIEIDRTTQESQRLFTKSTIVEDLGQEEMEDRAFRVIPQRATKLCFGVVEIAGCFFSDAALYKQTDVIGRLSDSSIELDDAPL
jgi:hypothetical protein